MRRKIIKLNFRDRWLEPKNITVVECLSKSHPVCHDFFIPTYEGQVECLLCTQFKKTLIEF